MALFRATLSNASIGKMVYTTFERLASLAEQLPPRAVAAFTLELASP